ncbi:hypothetical protein N9B39_01880 [bacterium]|nr:hypothetical protein [bacterium]
MLTLQYADLLSSEFGPLKLAGIRDKLIQRGNCRRYVKNLIQVIIQIFRHGVAREIVPPETLTALEALRRGEAHDNPPRRIPTLEEVVNPACQFCDGLSRAHDAGIIHRVLSNRTSATEPQQRVPLAPSSLRLRLR